MDRGDFVRAMGRRFFIDLCTDLFGHGAVLSTQENPRTTRGLRETVTTRPTRGRNTGKELVPYSALFSEQQKKAHWGTCAHCLTEGYDKKKCTRCQQAKYCNRNCQSQDFPRHKDFCKSIARFKKAELMINPVLRKELFCNLFMHLSYFLGSIPSQERYLLTGPRVCVLTEIVESCLDPSLLILNVKVRDVENRTMTIHIIIPDVLPINMGFLDIFSLETNLRIRRLLTLVTPGNFILIVNAYSISGVGSASITIDRPERFIILPMT